MAAASASHDNILVTGVAGLVAGAMSMAAGEYVSVHSQADTEAADLARESAELKADPATRSIPVIIVTSHVLDAVDQKRLLAEAQAVISKQNLSRELAINRIRDALQRIRP